MAKRQNSWLGLIWALGSNSKTLGWGGNELRKHVTPNAELFSMESRVRILSHI